MSREAKGSERGKGGKKGELAQEKGKGGADSLSHSLFRSVRSLRTNQIEEREECLHRFFLSCQHYYHIVSDNTVNQNAPSQLKVPRYPGTLVSGYRYPGLPRQVHMYKTLQSQFTPVLFNTCVFVCSCTNRRCLATMTIMQIHYEHFVPAFEPFTCYQIFRRYPRAPIQCCDDHRIR